MVIPHSKLSIDINRPNQYTVDFIAHVGDKNTRYIDITFNADGEPIELEQGCAATVTYVSDGVLIEQDAECDVDGSTVIVGIDTGKVENLRSGILEIQPKIVDGSGNIIVSQIPVLVRISPDIAEHGRVDDDSLGTYAEVVREIAAARGSYTDLKDRLNHIENGIEAVNQAVTAAEDRITTSESKIGTLEQEYQTVDQDLADIMDEMLLVEKTGNKVNIINPATPSNTDYPTTAAVVEYVNSVLRGLTNNGN